MTTRQVYQYCEICRTNYDSGVRHLYTKQHKTLAEETLHNFFTRIADCIPMLSSPEIVNIHEIGSKKTTFWCYMCSCSYNCHAYEEALIVLYAAMIEHLASSSHVEKVKQYWKKYRIPYNLHQFIFDKAIVRKFWELTSEKKLLHLSKMNEKIIAEAAKIDSLDKERKEFVKQHTKNEPNTEMEETRKGDTIKMNSFSIVKEKNEGKTRISDGAEPPWKQKEAEKYLPIVHPTIEDYQNHLKNLKKQALPTSRLGIRFDRSTVSSSWLPSFRQVWNHRRTTHSVWNKRKNKIREPH